MKLAAAFALLVASLARAQSVSIVYLSAPQVRLTCGETVQLTALARDAAGNQVNAAVTSWTSNNSAVARVDSTGSVQTAALGIADITATIGGRQGVIRLQVLPSRIEVTPARISVPFGATQQYDAVVYDVNDQPLPGAAVTWRVMVAGGTTDSTTLRISSSGVLSARTLGYYVVRASVLYPSAANQFEREFAGSTSLQVVPDNYTLKPLVSTANSFPAFRLRGKRGTIAANASGQVAFSTSLDGMTGALMTWRSGVGLSALATAGVPGLAPSSVLYDFDNASIDSRGNVLAQSWSFGTGNNLVLANSSGFGVLVPDRGAADAVFDVTNLSVSPFSLSDSGDALFRANFRYPESTTTYSGLLRYRDGLVTLEASSKDPLPGLSGTVSFDEWGIDGQGVLYFSASAGPVRAIYRKDALGRVSKLLAVNDNLAGQTVTQLASIAVAQAGDLAVRVVLKDNSHRLAWYPAGATTPALLDMSGGYVSTVSGVHPQGGVVFIGDAGPGFGLYRWPSPNAPAQFLLRRYGPSPSGEPVADFNSAAIDASGSVYATVRGVDTAWMLLRLTDSPSVLASNGSEVSTSANLGLYSNLVPGDRTGPVHLMAGGSQPSIFQANEQELLPALLVGDRLPGGIVYTGNMLSRKSASGDLYVDSDNAVVRLSPAGSSLVAAFPLPLPDGVNFNVPFMLAVNDAKQALGFAGTNASHQRLVLFDGKSARALANFGGSPPFVTNSPGGGVFQNVNDMALGESGQVMINAAVSGGAGGLFFYDGSSWKAACQLGSCRFDGELVTSIGSLRVANDRFCSVFNTSAGNQRLDCWEGGAWTNVLKRSDFTSDGTEINSVSSTFDMNRAGDFAVGVNTGLANQSIFLKTADGFVTVFSSVFPLPDGPYLTSIYSLDLRDDRRVYFVAMDNTSRMVVYEATPRF